MSLFWYSFSRMFASGLITFRETLEAALVVGIVFTFLMKTNQHHFEKFVFRGIAAGVGFALVLAIFLQVVFGGLTGKTEELFEGVLMFVTAGFLTWMILWVHRQKDIAQKIRDRVALHAQKGYGLGIFIVVSTAIMREGTETVLYLKASSLTGASGQLTGAIGGIAVAVLLSYLMFRWAMRVRLNTVFTVTNVFLLLFAAGLVSHGVHEFQEAGFMPIFSFDPVFNISAILDHKSTIGSFFRILFGYTSKPTVLELISYSSYIGFILWLERLTDRIIQKTA